MSCLVVLEVYSPRIVVRNRMLIATLFVPLISCYSLVIRQTSFTRRLANERDETDANSALDLSYHLGNLVWQYQPEAKDPGNGKKNLFQLIHQSLTHHFKLGGPCLYFCQQ